MDWAVQMKLPVSNLTLWVLLANHPLNIRDGVHINSTVDGEYLIDIIDMYMHTTTGDEVDEHWPWRSRLGFGHEPRRRDSLPSHGVYGAWLVRQQPLFPIENRKPPCFCRIIE
jgi:hypothetical protein